MNKDFLGSYMQQVAYHYILNDRELTKKISSDYFSVPIVAKCYDIAKPYALKYLTPPSKEVIKEELSRLDALDDTTEAQISMLYSEDVINCSIDKQYLKDGITNTAMWQSTVAAFYAAGEYIKKNDSLVRSDPESAKRIRDKIRMMIDEPLSINYEVDDGNGLDFWDAKSHIQEQLKRRTTGYKFIDDCMDGGYWDGSFVVFAGAPKVGKSQFLCNLCAESVMHGYNTMYITLELPEQMIIGRIGSNMFNIPHLDYDKISKSTQMPDIIRDYRNNHISPLGALVVKSYPTSSMTAEDLESFVLREELARSTEDNRFKFQNIFVDYINIMRNPQNEYTENTYIKIKNIAEHLKGVGVKNNWAIITATQMNKGQYDKSDAKAEDVAESSGLGATVDMLFGIIKDATCAINNQYYIKCIYDRVAPHQEEKKLFNFDGKYLRLKEDTTTPVISCLNEMQEVYKKASDNSGVSRSTYLQGGKASSVQKPMAQAVNAPKVPIEATQVDLVGDVTSGTNVNPRMYAPTNVYGQAPKSMYASVPTIPTDNAENHATNVKRDMFSNKNGLL